MGVLSFSNSFFDTSDDVNINDDLPCHTDVNIEDDQNNNIFDELKGVRRKHPHSFQCAYLNINSFRNKYCSIKELLNENLVDMIFIAESKLDDTFRNSEFNVENYHLWRADRNASGGGLLVYIRSDLACDRKIKLECKSIELSKNEFENVGNLSSQI
jgi:hypothetical protein